MKYTNNDKLNNIIFQSWLNNNYSEFNYNIINTTSTLLKDGYAIVYSNEFNAIGYNPNNDEYIFYIHGMEGFELSYTYDCIESLYEEAMDKYNLSNNYEIAKALDYINSNITGIEIFDILHAIRREQKYGIYGDVYIAPDDGLISVIQPEAGEDELEMLHYYAYDPSYKMYYYNTYSDIIEELDTLEQIETYRSYKEDC